MEKSEHVNNIFFPIVVDADGGHVVLCEVSGDIYHDHPGHLTISGSDLKKHAGMLDAIRASEAKLGHHKLMDRRIIISAAPLGSANLHTITGSSCLLALVLMDRALRHPETRATRRVIATGAVGPDQRIAAIPSDNTADYLAKIKNVDWQAGDIFICPADGLTSDLQHALDRLRDRDVDVWPIRHLNELRELWGSKKKPDSGPWSGTKTRLVLWGFALGAVLLIAVVGSRATSPPPPTTTTLPQPTSVPFESALGVVVLLDPQGGGAPIRTLAGHVFARGDRIGLELESSVAGQVAVFDASAGASATPIPLALAKVEGSKRLLLPATGSWTLDGAPSAAQTLAVAFIACAETACPPNFMTEAQAAVVRDRSGNTLSPPGRVALTSPHGQAAVARIALPY